MNKRLWQAVYERNEKLGTAMLELGADVNYKALDTNGMVYVLPQYVLWHV